MAVLTPLPITVFGRTTCEDTAIVRDRLTSLDVPFADIDLDADAGAAHLVESLTGGHQITPTLLFGSTEGLVTEPSLDDLDTRLLAEGWPVHRPEPVQFQGDLIARPIPMTTLVDETGAAFRLSQFRGRRQLAIFFAHAADCRGCAGYARQLAAVVPKLADGDARALVVVPGDDVDVRRWRTEVTDKVTIVADIGARWRISVGVHTQLSLEGDRDGGAMLVGLDRFLAPRIGSAAKDAGGLITPMQAAKWLEFASFECAECATPVGWTDE